MKKTLALALLATSLNAFGNPTCAMLEDAIEMSLKSAAEEFAGGLMDNSAPRESNRLLKINNEYARIGLNLQLMAQNKCPPYKQRIHEAVYLKSAIECQTAKIGNREAAKSDVCQYSNWKRSSYGGDK